MLGDYAFVEKFNILNLKLVFNLNYFFYFQTGKLLTKKRMILNCLFRLFLLPN